MRSSSVLLAAAAASLIAGAVPARADVFTVEAGYSPIFSTAYFTITNMLAVTENDVTVATDLLDPVTAPAPNAIDLGNLAGGASLTYYFAGSGGFLPSSPTEGVPDSTSYQVSAVIAGVTFATPWFSTVSNATGGYVDFLGNTTGGYGGGGVATSGAVAAAPEPASMAVLAAGLFGVGLARRRRC